MTAPALCERRAASARHWRCGRCLHIIDLETLAGTRYAPASEAHYPQCPPDQLLRLTLASYRDAIGIQRGDHAMVGLRSTRCGSLSDVLAHCGAQLRVASDPAGVRAALLDSADIAHAARRFDCLVVAGVHEEFTKLAISGHVLGMRIWLVGGLAPFAPGLSEVTALRSRLQLCRAAA
jgi:hypothetical protein